MKSRYARKIMNRYQRIVLYAWLKVYKTVSIGGMQVLMDVLPSDIESMRNGLIRMIKDG